MAGAISGQSLKVVEAAPSLRPEETDLAAVSLTPVAGGATFANQPLRPLHSPPKQIAFGQLISGEALAHRL